MSRTDFEQCTPAEFYEIYERWQTARRDAERGEWERARVLALYIAQPHAKHRLKAHDVLPLPWDNEQAGNKPREELSREELQKRYAAAAKRYGLE